MPNSQFFNLPSEKQKVILDCAFREFSENTFDKASIFSIAQKCNISRSSIYCYFKDKDDIYKYLVYCFMKPQIDTMESYKERPLFFLPKNLFEYLLSFYGTDKQNFVEKLLKNMNPENIHYIAHELKHSPLVVNENNIDNKTKYDLYIVSAIIIGNISIAISCYFEGKFTKQQAQEYFDRALEILKEGALGGKG